MREKIISIDVGAEHAEDKRGQSIIGVAVIEGCHYNTAIPLQELHELGTCHAFKVTGREVTRGNRCDFVFMPNEYWQNHGR